MRSDNAFFVVPNGKTKKLSVCGSELRIRLPFPIIPRIDCLTPLAEMDSKGSWEPEQKEVL